MNHATLCVMANVLWTKVGAKYDNVTMVELTWQRSMCQGKKSEKSAKLRVWDMVPEVLLFLEITELPDKTM